jgi:hypothetical protein
MKGLDPDTSFLSKTMRTIRALLSMIKILDGSSARESSFTVTILQIVILFLSGHFHSLFTSTAVIQVMPAILDVNVQQTVAAWRQISSSVPNLSAGKGSDEN